MLISVILVNYNDRPHLGDCLRAARADLAGLDAEIIVVDNASTDGSRDFLALPDAGVRLIANADNAGFAAGNNAGIRASVGDALLFLNTDTAVRPGAIRRLLETLHSDPAIDAVGPALIHPDGSFQVSFGRTVSFWSQFVQKTILNPFYKRALPRRKKPLRTGWLSAACMLWRADAVRRVGGFDETFFIYFEDIDMCRRLARTGAKLVFEPRARVVHVGGASTSVRADESRFEYRRSQLRFYAKHASPISLAFLRFYLRAVARALAVRGAFRGDEGRALREKYRRLLRERIAG